MSERISFPVFDSAGAPKTDATPVFLAYKTKAGGALVAPAITHLGGGVYGFSPSDSDVDSGVGYLISTGAFPKYHAGSVFLETHPFAVVNLTDASENLWTGAAPTIGIYKDFSGTNRAAPTPLALLGAHLFAVVPTLGDIATGTAFRIDAPMGASPAYLAGSFFDPDGAPVVPPSFTGMDSFENTIQGVVKAATGFDGGHVIWSDQTRTRPSRPFVELDYVSETTTNFLEYTQEDTPGAPEGEELTLNAREHLEPTVQMRVYSSAVVGNNSARNIARKIRAYFGRESVQSTLGDIALVNRNVVRDVSLVLETEHEGRAVIDMTFRVERIESETTTYIETAVVETTVEHSTGNVVRTLSFTQP